MVRELRRPMWTMVTLLVVMAVLAAPASAGNILVKMATLVPEGSSWYTILREMGEEWKTASGGTVTIRLYAGGVAGDDQDVVRKMRLGTISGGVLSSAGLSAIDRSVNSLQVPMMYASYDELYGVMEMLRPKLEQAFEEKGFVVLAWADGGWVQFFTKEPVRTPDDLRRAKLFSWAGDIETVEIWKAAGFNPIPLPSTEIATALQTGLVNALPTTPQAALLLQFFNHAPNMTELPWAVLLGAVVVSKATWDRIPAAVQPALREAAEKAGKRLRDETRQHAESDITAMAKRGLNVVHLDAEALGLWRAAAEGAYPRVRGGFVPADWFDLAMTARDEYRKGAVADK